MYFTFSIISYFYTYTLGFKMGRSIILCSKCAHFKPDYIDPSIGYCAFHKMEPIYRVRKNMMWCGPNASHFESIKNYHSYSLFI